MTTPVSTRILVVDDSPDASRVLARLLRLIGFDACCAFGGREALSLIRSDPPDLVILDVMMPEVGGMEVLGRLREDPRTAAVPVVMFTALTDEQTRAAARHLGASDYWVKADFDIRLIKQRIDSLLAVPAADGV